MTIELTDVTTEAAEVTPPKPSELMERGLAVLPPDIKQCRGQWFKYDILDFYHKKEPIGVCSLGLMSYGLGNRNMLQMGYNDLAAVLGWEVDGDIHEPQIQSPDSHEVEFTGGQDLLTVIVHLNDDLQWSFEQIIAWLKSVGQ